MTVKSYRDLEVWQGAMDLVVQIYAITKTFPREEMYGLTSQLRRAAVSVPSNIAEGRSKRSTRDFMRFINIAYGSLAEIETQLLISERLHYLSADETAVILEKSATIGRMLNGLLAGLEKKLSPNAESRSPNALTTSNSQTLKNHHAA